MSTVDTKTIFENLSNINELCGSLKSICEGASSEVSKIAEAAQALKNYDGQLSKRFETIINDDTKQISEFRWNVTVPDNYININSNFNTSDVTTAIDNLINELNTNESIVEFIEQEINNLIAELSVNEDLKDAYNNSFESLRKNISLDGYSAINNKFVKISDDYVQYWTDEPLRFEYNPQTGAYLIFQGSVAMGYTNKEGLMSYYNALTKVNEEKGSKEEVVEENTEEKVEETVVKEIFDVDLDESVKKELFDYTTEVAENKFSPNFEYIKEKAYNSLSDTTKQIVDGELKIVTKEIHHYVENREDIVVPQGKILTNIGWKNVLEGTVLKYDPDRNKYYGSGAFGFSIEDMMNGKFIDS